ncbi:SigB/SigF/SigG family RNA polymerase sigma factor [Streptomyces sp. NPDC091209]|uniref:RNA polymerase sigma factor SigF n=1 Tax=Streptomyces sp. NPDC091209 TaxID=3365974 RepID=UPI0038183214
MSASTAPPQEEAPAKAQAPALTPAPPSPSPPAQTTGPGAAPSAPSPAVGPTARSTAPLSPGPTSGPTVTPAPGPAPDPATGPSATPAPDPATSPTVTPAPDSPTGPAPIQEVTQERRRGADTRALTLVLFGELKVLEPGTPEHNRVRGALIEANLPLVRYAAARFRSRNEPMEDVVQVGTIGLINAIDRFDPDRGVQFPTFAMPTVVGEIKRYFRDNVRTVHVPRRLHELWVQVNSATEDLTTAFGRSPTTAEIAERLRISEEEVLSCIEAGRSYHATSLEAAQEGDGLPGLLDRLGYEDPALDGVEHRDLVRHLLVQLPEREQRILLLRYYSNLTQSQISAELGVSQMHVSRLLARSFARLRSANRIEA